MEEITTLMEQLALVSKESGSGPTTNAHEFINYELEFDLNNLYAPAEEASKGMLDGWSDATINEPIEALQENQPNVTRFYDYNRA